MSKEFVTVVTKGDPIYAAADGQVVYAADGLKEYGNLVLIKHIDGYISAYAHNSKMIVKSGDNVTAGQRLLKWGLQGLLVSCLSSKFALTVNQSIRQIFYQIS